jgi:hypothetical protein
MWLLVAQCKMAVTNPFDYDAACQANSTFMTNCGSCQICIWTYAIENPDLTNIAFAENGIKVLLSLCLGTTANDDVVALQLQVSRISLLGDVLTSGYSRTTTYSTTTSTYSQSTMTLSGAEATYTVTETASPSWSNVLSTATWASEYYSAKSAAGSFPYLRIWVVG